MKFQLIYGPSATWDTLMVTTHPCEEPEELHLSPRALVVSCARFWEASKRRVGISVKETISGDLPWSALDNFPKMELIGDS